MATSSSMLQRNFASKAAVANTDHKRANPADLLNLLKINNTLSDHAVLIFLATLRRGLDFSNAQPRKIISDDQILDVFKVIRCCKCKNSGENCTLDW